jgi:Flp pilus assembly protein TadG
MMWSVMINHISLLRLPRTFRLFAKDRRAIAAVEFALLLPLMVTLYLGGVEISQGIAADRKVTLTARSVADLAARVTTIDSSDMSNILNAGAAVMAPYGGASLKVTLTCVKIDSTGKATVSWSDTLNGTARSAGSNVTLPAALNVPNRSLLWSEVQYAYKPVIGYVITGTLTLKDQMYMAPRTSAPSYNTVACS